MDNGTDAARPPGSPAHGDGDQRVRDLRELRALLVGREQLAISELEERIESLDLTAGEVAELLPEAIALRAGRDEQLARALGPTLERAFGESVQRNPQQLAEAIYPTLGPAIRKAIAEAIGGLVAGLNRAMQLSLSPQGLRWRFEAWRAGIPFGQLVLQRSLVYRVEQVYLIHGETGLLLAHVAAPDLPAPDADVISGMLTAIRDFVGDAFRANAGGALRTFTVGDVTMLVEPGPRALLAATVRGQHPPALLTRLQSALELIHLRFARPLSEFNGNDAPFEAAKPLLAECLETVLDTEQRTRASAVPRIAWGLVFAAVLLLAFLGVRTQRTWSRARAVVAAEPGWVTLDADRTWRRWRFSGMRDPDARTPAIALAGAGFDTSRVRASWTPYLSADSAVVVARARRVLGAPASVTVSLSGDTVQLAGTAALAWWDRAVGRSIPGASVVSLDALTIELGPEHRGLTDAVTGSRLLFDVGSSALSPGAVQTLDSLARSWRRAQDAAGDLWHVGLTATGRTDTTGSAEMNRRLSDDRARVVAQSLAARGVARDAILARGIGTSEPLEAADRAERARINRSVTFGLELRRRPR
jgi:OOP family OmpA-OmpF porin